MPSSLMIDEQNPIPTPSEPEEQQPPSTEATVEEQPAAGEPDSTAKATESETAASSQDVQALNEQLQEQIRQKESMHAQALRIAADFENFRKRTQREKEELEQQVKRETISQLLPAIDSFERARSQIKPTTDGEMAIHKSYQGVYKQLVDGLKSVGVAKMRPQGQEFDPNYHEAMLREPTADYPEGTVIEELMPGYTIGDRVLRHAMVKVAAPPEPVITSEENSDLATENELQSENGN